MPTPPPAWRRAAPALAVYRLGGAPAAQPGAPDGSIYPSWSLKVVQQRALADLPEQDDAAQVRSAFLALAERALLTEQSFVLDEAGRTVPVGAGRDVRSR